MNLQLPLIKKWFKMTKQGIKTEDYRDITPYFCSRFLLYNGKSRTIKQWASMKDLYGLSFTGILKYYIENGKITFKPFTTNTMTLGYPKKTDSDRILKLEHKGIEISTGNPDWGAEPNKLYFVIKHGKIIQ
jgi:hypothetical protein